MFVITGGGHEGAGLKPASSAAYAHDLHSVVDHGLVHLKDLGPSAGWLERVDTALRGFCLSYACGCVAPLSRFARRTQRPAQGWIVDLGAVTVIDGTGSHPDAADFSQGPRFLLPNG